MTKSAQEIVDSGLTGNALGEAIWAVAKPMTEEDRRKFLDQEVTATVWHGTRRREPVEKLRRDGFCSYTIEQAQEWMTDASRRVCEKKKAKPGGLVCNSLAKGQAMISRFIDQPYRGKFSVTGVEEAACGEPDRLDSGWADRNPEFMNDLLMYRTPLKIRDQVLTEMFGKPAKVTLKLKVTARQLMGPEDIHTDRGSDIFFSRQRWAPGSIFLHPVLIPACEQMGLTRSKQMCYHPSMLHHQALLDKYSISVSETSRADLTAKMAEYLEWLGQRAPTIEEARKWITRMRQKGYSDNTLKKEWETIRQLYKVNDIPWEVKRGDAPAVDPEKVWHPSLDTDVIRAMVEVALGTRKSQFQRWAPDARDTCFLFLSTVWGPRRTEMASMSPKDINHKSNLIHINTLKGGRARWHWVPPDVMHFVTDWGFIHPTSRTTASQIFIRWRLAVGIETDQELGWHSIRHALAHSLTDAGVPDERREQFMRWAMKGDNRGMGRKYGTTPVVGFSEVRRELVIDEQKNDEAVLAAHPFLPYWRGKQ